MALYEVLADGTIVPKAGKTVGNLDCLRTELLWTNPNPFNEFPATEITLKNNWSDYFALIIEWADYNKIASTQSDFSNRACYMQWFKVKEVGANKFSTISTISGDVNSSFQTSQAYKSRIFYASSNNKINFGIGVENGGQDNYQCIPINIYGILKTPAMIYTGKELFNDPVTAGVTRTGQHDTVSEYYMSSDGNTWYRKWASGWKECGGTVSANSSNKVGMIVTLPIGFSDAFFHVGYTTTSDLSNVTGYVNYVDISIQPVNNYQVRLTGWVGFARQYYACGW